MKSNIRIKLLLLFFVFAAVAPVELEAGLFNKIKNKAKQAGRTVKGAANKVKKKVEHTLGWDRYILCWGDRLVPPQNRWVAIRSAVPRKKKTIGKFWDVPGDGKHVMGPNKEVKLWGITFQEYPQADRRYRFVPVYETTKNPRDFGYYWIQSKTGMWLQAFNKGQGLRLNKGYNVHNRKHPQASSYQWRVKNVGKNRFTFISRKNNLAIDARGGAGNKNGTVVQLWNDQGQKPVQWEFIYIAEGKEVKSTGQMAKNRANEVKKVAKKVSNVFGQIAKKIGKSISNQAKKALNMVKSKKLFALDRNRDNTYTFRIGLPEQKSAMDMLKENTIDKFVKIDFKKIVFEPRGKDKIAIGLRNRIECLGHHVDLTFEFVGKWFISKDGFVVKDFKMEKFLLPLLPHDLTKGVRNAVSNVSKKLKIHVKKFPGVNKIANTAGKAPLKVKSFKKGSYGFETTMSI